MIDKVTISYKIKRWKQTLYSTEYICFMYTKVIVSFKDVTKHKYILY